MDNPAVATFCRESLRNCLMIMGRDAFKAEVEYMLHCYGATSASAIPAPPTSVPAMPAGAAAGATTPPSALPAKWARKPVPDDKRCKKTVPHSGDQCTFKAIEGTDFCSRHTDD
jgi:hypothetical protein